MTTGVAREVQDLRTVTNSSTGSATLRGSAVLAGRLLGLLLAWPILTVLVSPRVHVMAKLMVAATYLVSLWNPAEGLLLAVGLAPLGALFAAVFDIGPFRVTEAILIAFFSASLLRAWPASTIGPRAPAYATVAAWLFSAVIVGSVAGLAWQMSHFPGWLTRTIHALAGTYFTTVDRIGVTDAAKLLEGIGLSAATILLMRRRPALAVQIPIVLAASSIVAALSAVLLWWGIAPDVVLERYARIGYRVSAHVSDLNAAGSYFVLVLCLALGMSLRDGGVRRGLWIFASAACAVGLWLSGSRSAVAAAVIIVAAAAVWSATVRWRAASRAAIVVSAVAALLLVGAIRIQRLQQRDPDFHGVGFRTQFAETSFSMIAARPWFGIGIGQYYPASTLFLTPQLAWTYGAENAHNNFLQIAAETGVVGFVAFSLWFGGLIAVAVRGLRHDERDWRLLGAFAGVLAFLGTCLGGHPLLVSEVASAFWIQLGLIAALGSSSLLNRGVDDLLRTDERVTDRARSALWRVAIAVITLVLIALPAAALRKPLAASDEPGVTGFYEWETGPDGARFRWTQLYASIFVPGDVARLEIPMRAPKEERNRREMGVEVGINGVRRPRFIASDEWTTLALDLAPPLPPQSFNRIDLRVDRTWRPALFVPGSADMRSVGVQVGECRLLKEPRAPFPSGQ